MLPTVTAEAATPAAAAAIPRTCCRALGKKALRRMQAPIRQAMQPPASQTERLRAATAMLSPAEGGAASSLTGASGAPSGRSRISSSQSLSLIHI